MPFFSAKFYEDTLDVRGFTRGAGARQKFYNSSVSEKVQSRGLAQEYYKNVSFAERSVSE